MSCNKFQLNLTVISFTKLEWSTLFKAMSIVLNVKMLLDIKIFGEITFFLTEFTPQILSVIQSFPPKNGKPTTHLLL